MVFISVERHTNKSVFFKEIESHYFENDVGGNTITIPLQVYIQIECHLKIDFLNGCN